MAQTSGLSLSPPTQAMAVCSLWEPGLEESSSSELLLLFPRCSLHPPALPCPAQAPEQQGQQLMCREGAEIRPAENQFEGSV